MIGAKQRPSFTQHHFGWISKRHLYQSGAGFTLIELLITAAIFSTAALLATTVFSNIQTTQRRVQGQQRVNTDGRYVVETIARSIRTGNINYAMFPNSSVSSNPTTAISTIDQNGSITCYRSNNRKVEVATDAAVDCLTNVTWTAFTPDDLQVDALSFFIQPSSDPRRPLPRADTDCRLSPVPDTGTPPTIIAGFDPNVGACICRTDSDCFTGTSCVTASSKKICTNPNVQPHVTIYIRTSSKTANAGEQAKSSIQTTVVSRLYQ